MEHWVTIGCAPDYEISDLGRIRRRVAAKNYPVGHIIAPTKDQDGYVLAGLCTGKVSKTYRVNRLVMINFVGDPPTPWHEAAHWNGIRDDNRLVNLRWATRKENHDDRYRHGTGPIGEQNGNAKLSDVQVQIIRARCAFGYSKAETARLFRCSDTHIGLIARRNLRAQAGGYGFDD